MTLTSASANSFGKQELKVLSRLDSPFKIQAFLDELRYSDEERYRCPRSVLRDRTAHCFDGAVFAAAALRRLGYPPLILNLFPDDRDDEHLLALYQQRRGWGAVAKSNFVGLRFREPIHRTLRELVLSYFEVYYNVEREKTLRSYTRPLNLKSFDHINWMTDDAAMEVIALRLEDFRKIPLITARMAAALSPIDERSYQAGLAGSNPAGLYRPPKN